MKKARVKRDASPVPQNKDELAEFVMNVGREQRAIDAITTDLNNQVEKLQAAAMERIKSHRDSQTQMVEGIYAYSAANRDELTDSGKTKTVKLPTGTIEWRFTPPRVTIKDEKEVIAACKSMGFPQFVRSKEEIAKDEMLKAPDVAKNIKGVSISQREEFAVKPLEVDAEVVSAVDKLKRAVE